MKKNKFNAAAATRREDWATSGPKCIVKVLPVNANPVSLSGYITLGRYLLGKTPAQIGKALGLPDNMLVAGAKIFKFKRLPLLHEVEYELTADHPGGLAFNTVHSDRNYLPGEQYIHQWEINAGTSIPVDIAGALELRPGQVFPYQWIER